MSVSKPDTGFIELGLQCKQCEHTEEYYVPPDNWPDDIECAGCSRNGPFEVVGNGQVEFNSVRPFEVDLSRFEQIQYRPHEDEYDPPDGHHKTGESVYMADNGDVSAIPDNSDLVKAIESEAWTKQRKEDQLASWTEVKQLFDDGENGTTTQAYNKAAQIINYEFEIRTVRETGHIYFYDSSTGIYRLRGETYLNEIINQNLGEASNENRRREIRTRVVQENYTDRENLQPPRGKVCLKNGVLDLDKLELEEWSPDYFFTARIQAEWPEDGEPDPWAEALWLKALIDGHDNPAEREKILRWVGYALEMWHHDLEQNLFFVGYRRSGKSTIQEAIQELFGSQPTVVNLSPQQIADTRFDAASLRDAALNTVNDINATKIKNSGKLKRVWSGESIKVEDKHKKAEFAPPKAKHLYTANWLPNVTGSDEAIFRRVMIVEFLKKVSKDKENSKYKSRLKREDVLQAILVTAAKARLRLRENNGDDDPADYFPADRDANETRSLWDSWRDPHKRFLYLQFEITADPDDLVERATYWQAAHEFADANGWEPRGHRSMTQALVYTPGIYTSSAEDDMYGGLLWRDVEAAKIKTSPFDADDEFVGGPFDVDDEYEVREFDVDREQEELQQERISISQSEKVKRVKKAIEETTGTDDTAEMDDVLTAALDRGIGEDSAKHLIAKLKKRGILTEPKNGRLRFT
jgi:P4 family phage/plasmid primase-like protien